MSAWIVKREYGWHRAPSEQHFPDEHAARRVFAQKVQELHMGRVLLLTPDGTIRLKATVQP